MSSSTEQEGHAAVLRGGATHTVRALPTPELRTGTWTRFGDSAVLGDAVTEQVLAGLAEQTQRAARAQGYTVGWAQGRREAAAAAVLAAGEAEERHRAEESRREEEHRAALAALGRAADGFEQAAARLALDLEEQALRLARELTEAIVDHELRHAPDPADDVVRRVLAVLPTGAPVTVALHPDVVGDAATALLGRHVRVVADPALGRHDAVVSTDEQVVEIGIAAALERVREALT